MIIRDRPTIPDSGLFRPGFIFEPSKLRTVSARTSALDTLVYGVDVQSGDIRGSSPSYALVTFDGETVDRDVVSWRRLLRAINENEPDFLATDNIYELAEDKSALIEFLRRLPDSSTLVQVTGDERPEPLARVANRHDVPYAKDPMAEAEAAARLAARNIGYEVSAFTDTTQVKISRGRSTGKGGWSEDRFTRRIHGSVKRRTREIQSALDEAGLDYTRDITEKYGGFSNAVFTVDAAPSDIPVGTDRSGDVRVSIERERQDGIEFHPLATRRDYVIIGVDPGTTTAVAVLGLDGDPHEVWSSRTASPADVIEWIVERGRPLLVATDVRPIPDAVEKLRRSFDAAEWRPENDLPVDEKLHRTRNHGYENDHERDALAAALFAHDAIADRIERVNRRVPPGIEPGEVLSQVLTDDRSIETAVASLQETPTEETTESGPEPRELTPEERRINRLESRIDRLESHIDDLEATIEAKDDTIAEYEQELETARREERQEVRERREVSRLKRETDRLERVVEEEREQREALEEKFERLKALWKLDHDDFDTIAENTEQSLVSLKPVEQFTLEAIESADAEFGLAKGDVIFLRDASGAGQQTAERLAEIEPRAILKHGGLSEAADQVLFEHSIPVGPAEEVTIREIDELAVAREADVEAVIDEWEDRASVRERHRNAEMVDRVISAHRAERRDVPPSELLDN